jgi:hypothetical protein
MNVPERSNLSRFRLEWNASLLQKLWIPRKRAVEVNKTVAWRTTEGPGDEGLRRNRLVLRTLFASPEKRTNRQRDVRKISAGDFARFP